MPLNCHRNRNDLPNCGGRELTSIHQRWLLSRIAHHSQLPREVVWSLGFAAAAATSASVLGRLVFLVICGTFSPGTLCCCWLVIWLAIDC